MIAGYETKLEAFRSLLEASLVLYYNQRFAGLTPPKVEIIKGRKFDKIVRVDSSRSLYCFVNKKTGGLLKGNWKQVEDRLERGNIFNDTPLEGCNPYGLDYRNQVNHSFTQPLRTWPMIMTLTNKQINDAEEAVIKLTEATNLSNREIIDVIADGFVMKYKGKLPHNIYDLIDELRATFDAY